MNKILSKEMCLPLLLALLTWSSTPTNAQAAPPASRPTNPSVRATPPRPSAPRPNDRPTGFVSARKDSKKPAARQEGKTVNVDTSKSRLSFYWDRPYMLAAYALVWIILFGYMLFVFRRQQGTQALLEQLQRDISDLEDDEDDD